MFNGFMNLTVMKVGVSSNSGRTVTKNLMKCLMLIRNPDWKQCLYSDSLISTERSLLPIQTPPHEQKIPQICLTKKVKYVFRHGKFLERWKPCLTDLFGHSLYDLQWYWHLAEKQQKDVWRHWCLWDGDQIKQQTGVYSHFCCL